jgi:2-oxoglutarate/2-oxoacid ferredoxin oxidoreductase subunit alpha
MLHALSKMKRHGVVTFQAEDEIAAVCAAIGASYGGAIGVTTSSGPGIALKMEGVGLAISAELPLVVVNVQRGGPSTGLPTKTEQADLMQAIFGRNGDTQLPVVAAATPGDCFDCAIEAVRLAVTHMTPVMLLSDGYIANAAEPWKLPGRTTSSPSRPVPHRSRRASSPTCAIPPPWRGPGCAPARPACSTASAGWRRITTAATSPTTRRTISA